MFWKLMVMRYVVAGLAPNSTLLGASKEDAALVDQWVHIAETEVEANVVTISQLCRGVLPYNKSVSLIISWIRRYDSSFGSIATHNFDRACRPCS